MNQLDPNAASSVFTRGAVDLAALKRSPQRPANPPPPAGGAPRQGGADPQGGGVTVIDVTEATFQSEVMERSLQVPVVVDFWAEWCGPCKQLSPMLEKLAGEGGGRWMLAKVDVDANQRLAAAFQVQSIPTVYAVIAGQPVDAFMGAVPEAQLRQWLDSVVAAAGGAAATVAPDVDPRIEEADEALAGGDLDLAEQLFREVLAEQPAEPLAVSGLAQLGLLRRVQGVDPRRAVADADASPDDVAAQTLAADIEMMSGRAEQAFARLVDTVRRTSGDDRETARTHLISLFQMAEPGDPAVGVARRQLASALY